MASQENAAVKPSDVLQDLLFRRQFLLGPSPFKPTKHWRTFSLDHGLVLSVHPDLKVSLEARDGIFVTLVGFAVDPFTPHETSSDIARSLARNASDISDILVLSAPLAGRWIIIFQNQEGTILFTDPCGFRQVFYHSSDSGLWCGSQPEIIKAVTNKLVWDTDEDLLRFMMSSELARTESAWVGVRTPYANCYHLLPNHYLKVNSAEQIRFFPYRESSGKKTSEIVESAVSILRGILTAIAGQQKVLLALTAGWDSRVLLAASRDVSHNVEYYVDRKGELEEDHPDVWVPTRLAKKLGLNFVVKNSRDHLPGWFVCILARNITGARILPKSRMIYAKYVAGETRININGNGSEICRNFFDKYCKMEPKEIGVAALACMLDYKNIQYVKDEIEKWRKGLLSQGVREVNVLDMLYWEQRLGNWGAQFSAEQDIANEEVSPFNCRLLIETLLAAPRYLRAAPEYTLYRTLIQSMWPEALSIPINPAPRSHVVKLNTDFLSKRIRPLIPSSIVTRLRKLTCSRQCLEQTSKAR